MTDNQKYWLAVIGVAALLAIIGIVAYVSTHHAAPNTNTPGSVASTTSNGGTTIQTSGGQATVTEIQSGASGSGSASAPKEPSLDRPETFEGSPLDPASQKIIASQITTIEASLKSDPTQLDLWIKLGVDRKMAGDYEGAKEAWTYVNELAPKDEISAANLADLYANFLHDYPAAVIYYKKAIAADPHQIDNYRNLYVLYHASYEVGTGADLAVIQQGLAANPGNQDLLTLEAQATGQATTTAQ